MKKIWLIILVVIIVAAFSYLSFFLVNKYRNKNEVIGNVPVYVPEEENTTASVSETTTTIDKSLYFSRSENYANYFFKIPEGWSVYEKDNGERLVLNNSESNESIIINIVSADDAKDLSEP
ncbi:MAG TPA: hypothetical protein DCY00_00475, partial [Actinobacteria bacterium]|nr:hypothetical protein [Actinomycetota bacterium]